MSKIEWQLGQISCNESKIYDENNIFAKILKGEIACKKIYEDDHVLSFYDIRPEAKVHALIIPKLKCVDFSDFCLKADKEQLANFFVKTKYIAEDVLHLKTCGYRIKTNNGVGVGQEVFHFHLHLVSNG